METIIESLENVAAGLLVLLTYLGYAVILLGITLSNRRKRIRELEAGYHEALAQLLHCQAFDSTVSNQDFGIHLTWDALSKAEKAYWMARVETDDESGG